MHLKIQMLQQMFTGIKCSKKKNHTQANVILRKCFAYSKLLAGYVHMPVCIKILLKQSSLPSSMPLFPIL